MIQDTKKNNGKTILIIIGLVCVVFIGCKIVKSTLKPRDEIMQNTTNEKLKEKDNKEISKDEMAVNVLYSFLQRGVKDKDIPTLNEVNIDRVFYLEEDNNKLICASYHPSFSNGNHPTWETCLKTDDGNEISKTYDSMDYIGILTEAAFIYKMLPETNQLIEIEKEKVEEVLNQRLKDLTPDDNEEDNSPKKDKKIDSSIPMA